MAKYTVSHICGHDETHNLFGPTGDRQRKMEWLRTVPCSACHRADMQADRERAAEESARINAERGLPALLGSPKQIAWAEEIRARLVAELRDLLARVISNAPSAADAAAVQGAAAQIESETSAAQWIEWRNSSPQTIIRQILGR